MNTHHPFDSITSLQRMVERDPGSVVMQDVSGDGTMEEMLINYAEFAIYCRGSATEERPAGCGIIRE